MDDGAVKDLDKGQLSTMVQIMTTEHFTLQTAR